MVATNGLRPGIPAAAQSGSMKQSCFMPAVLPATPLPVRVGKNLGAMWGWCRRNVNMGYRRARGNIFLFFGVVGVAREKVPRPESKKDMRRGRRPLTSARS